MPLIYEPGIPIIAFLKHIFKLERQVVAQSSSVCLLALLAEDTTALDTSLFCLPLTPQNPVARESHIQVSNPATQSQATPSVPVQHGDKTLHSAEQWTQAHTAGPPAEMCKYTMNYSRRKVCYSDSCPSPSPQVRIGKVLAPPTAFHY